MVNDKKEKSTSSVAEKVEQISTDKQPETMVPLSRVSGLIEQGANKVMDMVMAIYQGKMPPTALSRQAEDELAKSKLNDDEKDAMRVELKILPTDLQASWLQTCFASNAENAWNQIRRTHCLINNSWVQFNGVRIEPVESAFMVYHSSLANPVKVINKDDAIHFAFIVMNASDNVKLPTVSFDADKQVYVVVANDTQSEVKSVEEAQQVIEKDLKQNQYDEFSAQEYSKALVDKVQAKIKETEGMEVKADSKQVFPGNPKKPLVSGVGVPTDKISQPKKGGPDVPGYVSTEGPAVDAIPKVKTGKDSIQFSHEKGAQKSDAEIQKINRGRGLVSEMQKLASEMVETEEGTIALEQFVNEQKAKKEEVVTTDAIQSK